MRPSKSTRLRLFLALGRVVKHVWDSDTRQLVAAIEELWVELTEFRLIAGPSERCCP